MVAFSEIQVRLPRPIGVLASDGFHTDSGARNERVELPSSGDADLIVDDDAGLQVVGRGEEAGIGLRDGVREPCRIVLGEQDRQDCRGVDNQPGRPRSS